MKERKGFLFYRSFYEAIKEMPEGDRLPMIERIIYYALDGVEPNMEELGALGRAIWKAIEPSISSDRQNFINGCGGGAPRGNQNARKYPKEEAEPTASPTPIKSLNGGFTPPTIEEIMAKVRQSHYNYITRYKVEKFIEYYNARGWQLDNGNVMRDWWRGLLSWLNRN